MLVPSTPFAFEIGAGARSSRGQYGVYIMHNQTTTLNEVSEKQKDEKRNEKTKKENI